MKKSFRLLLALSLIGGLALSFSSCKDSENVSNDPNSLENIALSKESETAKALLNVLSFTSELDSLPDNWASNSFTIEPTVGIVNDASTPYVRYIPVVNKEEAITKYNSFAGKGIAKNANSASWNIENVGSMTFNVLDQADVTATLDINIKQQPHLTQIRFVPASALGVNSIKEDPYYSFGDVIELTEGQNKSYWICVRPCSKLDDKGKSHWLSFQLNDWNDKELKNVEGGSLNFAKLTKKGYQDYYLPTQLGDSREHLQNLFRLLMALDAPALHEDLIRTGIGTNNPIELSYTKVNMISKLWEKKKIWDTVLPQNVKQEDLSSTFGKVTTEVNVFYKGYHSTPSVYMATLQGKSLELKNTDKDDDEIQWKRTKAGVDFHDYAIYGLQNASVNQNSPIAELPQKGYIVRYKTGAKLVGKWAGEDQDYKHSFTDQHRDIIRDVYVFNKDKGTLDKGASAMGDEINDADGITETCVLNNSNYAPKEWNDFSYYFKFRKASENIEDVYLQNETISISAYLHLLNALMLDYASSRDILEKLPNFSEDYKLGLIALWASFPSALNIQKIVSFEALDQKSLPTHDIEKVAKFTITFPYQKKNYSEDYYFTAYLTYDINSKKYEILHNDWTIQIGEQDFLCLKGYKDVNAVEPPLEEGQKFYQTYLLKDRENTKKASIDFITKYAPK